MYSLLIGVDVSKDLFSTAGIDSKGAESFSNSHSMDSGGFGEFLKILTSHCEDFSKVIIGMESTGCYHINPFSFLVPLQKVIMKNRVTVKANRRNSDRWLR